MRSHPDPDPIPVVEAGDGRGNDLDHVGRLVMVGFGLGMGSIEQSRSTPRSMLELDAPQREVFRWNVVVPFDLSKDVSGRSEVEGAIEADVDRSDMQSAQIDAESSEDRELKGEGAVWESRIVRDPGGNTVTGYDGAGLGRGIGHRRP